MVVEMGVGGGLVGGLWGGGGFTQMCTDDLQRAPQNASVQTYTLRRLSAFPATKTKTKMKDPVLWDSTTVVPLPADGS